MQAGRVKRRAEMGEKVKGFQPFAHKFVSALHPQTCKPYMALRNKAAQERGRYDFSNLQWHNRLAAAWLGNGFWRAYSGK
jgi:hypothetical protein